MPGRKIIVNIATSADGFIARRDGDLEWLTRHPAPKGFYGMGAFTKTIDTKVMGRGTYEASLRLGATFAGGTRYYVFSRRPPAQPVAKGVEFVSGGAGEFADRLRAADGKDIWLMGGAGLIASFLDERAIDEFIITVMPVFIGEGIPLIAARHRDVPLRLLGVESFANGVVQVRYDARDGASVAD